MREIRASDPNYRGVKCADCGEYLPFLFGDTCTYCTIQKKDRRIAELEAALQPFVHPDLRAMLGGNAEGGDSVVFQRNSAFLRIRDFERAAQVLEEK